MKSLALFLNSHPIAVFLSIFQKNSPYHSSSSLPFRFSPPRNEREAQLRPAHGGRGGLEPPAACRAGPEGGDPRLFPALANRNKEQDHLAGVFLVTGV